MQLETKVIPVFDSQSSDNAGKSRTTPTPTASRFDTIAASVVIGLTAWFVIALFGLVTNMLPGLLFPLILGALCGVCSGLIAYLLMKDGPEA